MTANNEVRWDISGYTVMCQYGRCHRESFRLVIRESGGGHVRLDKVLHPINPDRGLLDFWEDRLTGIFPPEQRQASGD